MIRLLVVVIIAGIALGCSPRPDRTSSAGQEGGSAAGRDGAGTVQPDRTVKVGQAPAGNQEMVVRAAVAMIFKVDGAAVKMDRPLGDPPLNADDLDLVELVMVIEEGLSIEIPDQKLEELQGGSGGKVPIRITPAQLVGLAKRAKHRPGPTKR